MGKRGMTTIADEMYNISDDIDNVSDTIRKKIGYFWDMVYKFENGKDSTQFQSMDDETYFYLKDEMIKLTKKYKLVNIDEWTKKCSPFILYYASTGKSSQLEFYEDIRKLAFEIDNIKSPKPSNYIRKSRSREKIYQELHKEFADIFEDNEPDEDTKTIKARVDKLFNEWDDNINAKAPEWKMKIIYEKLLALNKILLRYRNSSDIDEYNLYIESKKFLAENKFERSLDDNEYYEKVENALLSNNYYTAYHNEPGMDAKYDELLTYSRDYIKDHIKDIMKHAMDKYNKDHKQGESD